ncbi:MAG TPA: inositol monophosphatase [Usitatibacter sp.]|nr:inositol monophosphatase [Usitatibacter sp.]
MEITARFAELAIEAVRRVAVDEILPRYRRVAAIAKDDGSIVTEADLAAQDALGVRLRALCAVPVLGEEMDPADQRAIHDRGGRYWCVDPLDGTKNFSSGVPFFAISVALVDDARPVFGTVYDPIADEAYHAVRGEGAALDGNRLVVPASGPPLALAVAEVSLRREIAKLRAPLKHRKPYARRLTSGSSALSWCHLAGARIDVMLHGGQKMWDYAAGALIFEEAGGFAASVAHDDFWAAPPWSRSVIAARSAPLLDEFRAWILRELESDSGEDHGTTDEHR